MTFWKDKEPEKDFKWTCELCKKEQVNIITPVLICGACIQKGWVWAANKAQDENKSCN